MTTTTTTKQMGETNETGWLVQVERAWGIDTIPCEDRASAKTMAKRITRDDDRNTAYFFAR